MGATEDRQRTRDQRGVVGVGPGKYPSSWSYSVARARLKENLARGYPPGRAVGDAVQHALNEARRRSSEAGFPGELYGTATTMTYREK